MEHKFLECSILTFIFSSFETLDEGRINASSAEEQLNHAAAPQLLSAKLLALLWSFLAFQVSCCGLGYNNTKNRSGDALGITQLIDILVIHRVIKHVTVPCVNATRLRHTTRSSYQQTSSREYGCKVALESSDSGRKACDVRDVLHVLDERFDPFQG